MIDDPMNTCFALGCYAARSILNLGGSDKSDRAVPAILQILHIVLYRDKTYHNRTIS